MKQIIASKNPFSSFFLLGTHVWSSHAQLVHCPLLCECAPGPSGLFDQIEGGNPGSTQHLKPPVDPCDRLQLPESLSPEISWPEALWVSIFKYTYLRCLTLCTLALFQILSCLKTETLSSS